jgi:hypothetical protein
VLDVEDILVGVFGIANKRSALSQKYVEENYLMPIGI